MTIAFNAVRFPISFGIVPESSKFPPKSISPSSDKETISFGMLPARLLSPIERDLKNPAALHVLPNHLQTLSPLRYLEAVVLVQGAKVGASGALHASQLLPLVE